MINHNYLGLSLFVGRSKVAVFQCIKYRHATKIHRWNNQHMSLACKAILIQSVAQALHT